MLHGPKMEVHGRGVQEMMTGPYSKEGESKRIGTIPDGMKQGRRDRRDSGVSTRTQ